MQLIKPPYPVFFESDGSPLDQGYLYFGEPDQNPQTNPVAVFWDREATQPAAQPIRTINGYPVRYGTPANVYIQSQYSVSVLNKRRAFVYYTANSDIFTERADSLIFRRPGGVDRTVENKLLDIADARDFGLPMDGVSSALSALIDAIADSDEFKIPAGLFILDGELPVNKSITIHCTPANEYGIGGTRFLITHDSSISAGIFAGKNNKTIRFELTGNPKFDAPAGMDSLCSVRCESATTYIDGVQSTARVNGVLVKNSYIGEIRRLSGPSKDYLLKTEGDTSLKYGTINAGGTVDGSGAIQLAQTDGHTVMDHLYLEAQATGPSLVSADTGNAVLTICNLYGENSPNEISIAGSSCLTIENYRTNTNTGGLTFDNCRNARVNNVHSASGLYSNAAINITETCRDIFIGGVRHNPSIRAYSLIRGTHAGKPAASCVTNAELLLSARGTVSTVGGASVAPGDYPDDARMQFSDHSIVVDNTNPLRIPITRWRADQSVVITLIYKCTTAGQQDVILRISKTDTINVLTLDSFHVGAPGYQMLTFVAKLPPTFSLDDESSLEVRCAAGKTAYVHYFNMHHYDGGELPLGTIDESELFISSPLDINTFGARALVVPRLHGKAWRIKSYDLAYRTPSSAGSGAQIQLGDATGGGVMGTPYATFTTAANESLGALANNLAPFMGRPFRDHFVNQPNGWIAEVTVAGTTGGTAVAYLRCVPCDANTVSAP